MQQLILELKSVQKESTTTIKLADSKEFFSIGNRRFLGNKQKLLEFIASVIKENTSNINSICDIFSGTGVVGHYLSTPNNKVIFNDLLKSCTVPIKVFSTTTEFDQEIVDSYVQKFNNLKPKEENYFSTHFGGKYFTKEVARKIGRIRYLIEGADVNESERNILLTSLLYAADRIANTVGHYDAYIKNPDPKLKLELRPLRIEVERNKNNVVCEEDANALIRKIKTDLIYIDPPYNSRQYSDTYHLLENLIRWEKPEVYGKASKMDRSALKSKYCLKSALDTFRDLIGNINCRYILMSYNNTGDQRDGRSNNRISSEEIIETLEMRGKVNIFEKSYREFNSGKTVQREDHKETLYFCEIN